MEIECSRRHQNQGFLGFEIEDRKGKRSDPKSASTRNQRTSAAKIVSDYRKRLQKIGKTEVERLGKARIGQDIFRKALLKEWEGCPLTKITDERLLRASHIKPWSQCASDLERLDPDNGLLLSSLWDAAFDAGLVTFSDDGKAMDSSKLGAQAKIALQFDAATPLELTSGRKAKLKWHRSNRFQK